MSKPRMIVYGSHGMGEIIHITPLLKAVDRIYDTTLVVAAWQEPFVRSLSFYTGKVVAFNDNEGRYGFRTKNGVGGRVLRITREFANRIDVWTAEGIAPVLSNGVCVNDRIPMMDNYIIDEEVPNLRSKQPRDDQQNRSFPDKMCRIFGFDSADLRMYVTPPQYLNTSVAFNASPTIVFCNSAEHLRRMPEGFVHTFMRRFIGVRFLLVGYLGGYNMNSLEATAHITKNTLEFHDTENLSAQEMEKSIAAIHVGNVIIGPDCGWSWVGLAAFKRVILLESRVNFESLVPRIYWGTSMHYKKKVLTCDRQCCAERHIVGVNAESPEMVRPFDKWENYSAMSPEWQKDVYSGTYPRNLSCWNTPCAPCLDYDGDDITAIVNQAVEMYRPLNNRMRKM